MSSVVVCGSGAHYPVRVVTKAVILESISNVEVNALGSRGGRRARSRLGVAPCTRLSFIGELVRGVVGAGRCLECAHSLVHGCGSCTENVESYVSVQAELGEGVPVCELKEQVRNGLIIAQWEEPFKSRHYCL